MKGLIGAGVADAIRSSSGSGDSHAMVAYPAAGLKDSLDAKEQGGSAVAALQTALAFVMFTLAAPGSPSKLEAPRWLKQLKSIVASNQVAAVWLLQTLLSDRTLLRSMLLRHADKRTREAFGELVSAATTLVASVEEFGSDVDIPPALKRRSSSVGVS